MLKCFHRLYDEFNTLPRWVTFFEESFLCDSLNLISKKVHKLLMDSVSVVNLKRIIHIKLEDEKRKQINKQVMLGALFYCIYSETIWSGMQIIFMAWRIKSLIVRNIILCWVSVDFGSCRIIPWANWDIGNKLPELTHVLLRTRFEAVYFDTSYTQSNDRC